MTFKIRKKRSGARGIQNGINNLFQRYQSTAYKSIRDKFKMGAQQYNLESKVKNISFVYDIHKSKYHVLNL